MNITDIKKKPFGPIRGVLLLGGGGVFRDVLDWAQSQKIALKVVTAPRHSVEEQDGESLLAYLQNRGVDYIVVSDLDSPGVAPFLSGTEGFLCLSLGASWIFRPHHIEELFRFALFNVHGSCLPRGRGGAVHSWQILMGNRFGCCIIHRVDSGVDTGEIIAQEDFIYPVRARTPLEYEAVYREKAFGLVRRFVSRFLESAQVVQGRPQQDAFATYWPRLHTESNGLINWGMTAQEIERFICAFDDPYRGASTFLNGHRVFVKSVSLSSPDESFHPYQTGLIYRKSAAWICVAVPGATLIIEDLRNEEGDSILAQVKVGDRFLTPLTRLERARKRVRFDATGPTRKNGILG